jgi:hypothetical protein
MLLALVAGCTSAPTSGPGPTLGSAGALPPSSAVLSPSSALSSAALSSAAAALACPAGADLPADAELQGNGEGVTLWALFFGPRVIANQEMKIVWRMTGSGALTMTAEGPGGRLVKPAWGPEEHGGSNYNRPGDEWGTGWVFPQAGCWTITATRGSDRARLALRVA